MRDTAGNAAAPTVRRSTVRRGSFMTLPPWSALRRGRSTGRAVGTDYSRLARGGSRQLGLGWATMRSIEAPKSAKLSLNPARGIRMNPVAVLYPVLAMALLTALVWLAMLLVRGRHMK